MTGGAAVLSQMATDLFSAPGSAGARGKTASVGWSARLAKAIAHGSGEVF